MIHKLKIRSRYLDDLISGKKKAEVRINDRNYQVGDMLEFDTTNPLQNPDIPNGIKVTFHITHIHKGIGLARGYVMLSVERMF
jgi:ASC-1-like (ASCH) protein